MKEIEGGEREGPVWCVCVLGVCVLQLPVCGPG